MKSIRPYFLLLAICFLWGCATATVSSDYDRSADFSLIKTYDWPATQQPSGDMRFDDPDLRAAIERAVDSELQRKGLQKTSAQPDILLKYYITVEQKVDSVADYYPPAFHVRTGAAPMASYAARDMTAFRYEEGTFVLDFVDAKSGAILWRGTLEGMVDPAATSNKRIERAPESIAKVLKKFPPA